MSKNIKFRVYFTQPQYSMFSNALFACQMLRNYSLQFLKNRYFAKRTWLKSNANTPEYLAYLAENTKYLALLKEFKEQYPSKDLQKANKDKQPIKPERFHALLESNSVALNTELTAQLDKSRVWLLNNLPNFKDQLEKYGISIPSKSPQNICVFYNSLPLSVRKALGKSARNENVLLYLLGSPRSCLVQVLQDLDKTFTKAFKEREKTLKNNKNTKSSSTGQTGVSGKPLNTSGFPNFKKLSRTGGIRFQLDDRHSSFTNAWKNQQIVTSEFGELNWHDSGYILPQTPAKMLTIKKEKNGQIFAVFYGVAEYNDKRTQQHVRAVARKTVVNPACSVEEFFDTHSVSIDLNRTSGQIQVVTDSEQDNGTHVLSLNDHKTEAKRLKKIQRREAYIKRQQQRLARQDIARKKGRGKPKNPNGLHRVGKHSARRMQTQDKIAKACAKDSNQAVQYMRDLVQKLIDGKTLIMAEDLGVQSMLTEYVKNETHDKTANTAHTKTKVNRRKRKNNNRSQIRARFSMFMTILEDACAKNNVVLLQCDRYDPTSQLCSSCGYHWGKLDTTVREITCAGCGTTHDRDVNSTKNIKFLALYRYAKTLEKESAGMHTKKQLGFNPNHKPLAESVNGRQVGYTHLSEIAHEDLISYINGHYPIKTVLKTIEKLEKKYKASLKKPEQQSAASVSCVTTHHPRFSKTKSGTKFSIAG